jgi:hypothetical protein
MDVTITELADPRNSKREPVDTQRLREQWFAKYKDILSGVPPELPPLREINHRIPLIDESKRYFYRLPRCPDAMKPQLMEKLRMYTDAGWWVPKAVQQAAPLLCIPKKSGKLRTVVDCHQRNDNTLKDVTPFPDQDQIRMDVARAKYRSKIDLSNAYEQVRIDPEDVHKTGFATVYGTLESNVMQQGDCNAPGTFQRLITVIFRDEIGIYIHVYLDDLFIFSDTLEEHEIHLERVFQKLRENHLFLEIAKCDLYSTHMDCLGHLIDDRGLHADADKMARVRNWRTPRNLKEVQRFLGLVQYLAHFMPDITAYTGPLSAICRNGQPYYWKPLHEACFNHIKAIACKSPILKPIDPQSGDPVWVICDASMSGIGAMYGQGETWQTCRPAGFMSKKFTAAQMNYRVFEMETIAILEALLKWEDKLLGRKILVVTDHKALEFFKTQRRLNSRQARWMEFLARFDFDITYVKGETNLVADALSRYYEGDNWDEHYDSTQYVTADARLDPEGEDLPWDRFEESRAMREPEGEIQSRPQRQRRPPRRADEHVSFAPKHPIAEAPEPRHQEAAELAAHEEADKTSPPIEQTLTDPLVDPTVSASLGHLPDLRPRVEGDRSFLKDLKLGYTKDPLCSKVLDNVEHYKNFEILEDLIYTRNRTDESVLCIPSVVLKKRRLTEVIIAQAHEVLGHFGPQKTAEYIRRHYWWPRIGQDVEQYCKTCPICQTTKSSTQRVPGLLHSLPIPARPWGSIAMDFVGPFPESGGYDYLWVIICRLTSMVHLVPIRTTTKASELAWLYIKEIVRLHGLAESIVSDRDSKFTSRFWRETHKLLGAKLLMSTSFHPQTDGASERAIRSIAQILRAMVRPDQWDWTEKIPMVEFALNSTISSSSGFAPFELNYGYIPIMSTGFAPQPVSVPGVKHFVERALQNLTEAHDAIIESRVRQTHNANRHRRADDRFAVGDLVYVSTSDLSLPKGRASKLLPKYVGPFKVLEAQTSTSSYKIELPAQLRARNLHDRFHRSRLRPYHANDDALFPHREAHKYYDFGTPDDQEWLVEEILAHTWDKDQLKFQVHWNLGDTTWEPHAACKDLQALDDYLQLFDVVDPNDLPRKDGSHTSRNPN